MNAFDTSGPALTAPSKAERAYTRQGLQRTAQVGHMSVPRVSRFSTPIVSRAARDKTTGSGGGFELL